MKHISLILIIFLISCKKDITNPVISNIKLNSVSDTLVLNLDSDSKYLVEALIEDDNEINQIRFFSSSLISSTPSDSSLFTNYVYSLFLNADVTPYSYSDSITIPNNTCAGLYSLNVSAVDKEGNEGVGEPVYILLTSSEAPSETITLPDFTGIMPSYSPGDTIKINGTVMDNIAVQKVTIYLFDSENNTISSQGFTITDTIITNWDFQTNNAQLILPTVMDAGNYNLRIDMGDNDGNLSFFLDSLSIN
jgi:hypothetical protein